LNSVKWIFQSVAFAFFSDKQQVKWEWDGCPKEALCRLALAEFSFAQKFASRLCLLHGDVAICVQLFSTVCFSIFECFIVRWETLVESINKMSLAPGTRCTFVILALTILPNQFHCQVGGNRNGNGNGHGSHDSLLAESQMTIFTLTLLGLFVLVLLGFVGEFMCLQSPRSTGRTEISDFLWAGCICCFCRISRAVESTSDGLDVYAPRTQSIVWPTLPLPQEAGRVLEMTFLHAPKVNCLCRNCCLARNAFCIENCGVITHYA